MCSICKDVLVNFAIAHTEFMCPLRNSMYCCNCAKYGHLTKACPSKPSNVYTEPFYLEQLISAENIKEFNITSMTPIKYIKEDEQQLLEILDDDKVIASYLLSQSIKVPKGTSKRIALEKYAKLQNKRLVYIK